MTTDPLAVLGHELRSPVAALVAIAEAYPTADENGRRRLRELARGAVANLERLFADAAAASVRLVPLEVGRVVTDVVELAVLGGAAVVARAEVGLILEGDPERLRQALGNLVANAVAHSPDGSTVVVTAGRRAGSVEIAVTDEGEGIGPDDLERVFEAGVRLTATRPGAGIGLALVRAIARAHGGDVHVGSSPGQGSTFTLVLPSSSDASRHRARP